jgi:RHS repeat-associated protein
MVILGINAYHANASAAVIANGRLLTAETTSTYSFSPAHCWGEAYVYDNATTTPGELGNLTNINVASSAYNGCTQESLSVVASATNQITSFSYDASGTTLNDTHNSYTWNAESEIKTAAGVTYTYDGDGNRLQKSSGKIYWYGAGTEILDESDSSGNITDEYVYFGGKRVAHRVVSGNSMYYYGEDFLGTSRQIFTSASALCYDADFYPFGGERPYTNTCPPTYKFEGKERDTETNNDDFGARYYSSSFGRWTSPDWSSTPAPVPYADLTNPQSLNLYGFVKNDPETFVDADGHCCDLSDVINFVTGAANAYGSDNFGGVGRQQQSTNAGKFGQAVGDAAATFEGAEKMITGGTVAVASVPADATGAGALVGVPAGVAGTALAVQGTVEASQGASNLLKSSVDTLAPGPHAGDSVPARGPQRDFTPEERNATNQAGKDTGCHTCGTKDPGTKGGNFVPDHQPPSALNQNNKPQQLYPHCLGCSQTQGGQVNAAKNKQPPSQ